MKQLYHQDEASVSSRLEAVNKMRKMVQTEGECNIMDNIEKNTYVKASDDRCSAETAERERTQEYLRQRDHSIGQVGRISFYRNYKEKEDILKEYILTLFGKWMKEYDDSGKNSNDELMGAMFAHLSEYGDFYRLLSDRKLLYLLKDVITWICGPKPEYPNLGAYVAAFISSGLYGWIEEWFARGMHGICRRNDRDAEKPSCGNVGFSRRYS